MEIPPNADELMRLRCLSKSGARLHPDDSKKCIQAFQDYEEWYSSTEREVFERTKPFGAH